MVHNYHLLNLIDPYLTLINPYFGHLLTLIDHWSITRSHTKFMVIWSFLHFNRSKFRHHFRVTSF